MTNKSSARPSIKNSSTYLKADSGSPAVDLLLAVFATAEGDYKRILRKEAKRHDPNGMRAESWEKENIERFVWELAPDHAYDILCKWQDEAASEAKPRRTFTRLTARKHHPPKPQKRKRGRPRKNANPDQVSEP